MQAVIREKAGCGCETRGRIYDLNGHSTAGLVMRGMVVRYYPDGTNLSRHGGMLMLAPANFGSRLATFS